MKHITFLLCTIFFALTATVRAEDAYLFTYFTGNGEDGLHLASSSDGLTWTALKDGKSFLTPTVGKDKLMRDPSICRGPDGTFHMVWTTSWTSREIGCAHSKDLVNWSGQKSIPVMEHEPTTRNSWAPELFYDRATETYYIFWASTIPGKFENSNSASEDNYNHRMYYTTTKDFETFTPTKLFFDPGHNVIDAFLAQDGNKYLLFYKDETLKPQEKKHIILATGNSPIGPFENPKVISHINWVEGPSAIKIDGKWIVYYDCYTKRHYGAVESTDLKNWTNITEKLKFPKEARHGTVFRVEKSIVDALQ